MENYKNVFAPLLILYVYPLGMGRYTYLPIRYYHDTWVPIRYVLQFVLRITILKVLRFDIAMCWDFLLLFLTLDHGKKSNIHLIYRLSQ